MLRVCPGSCDYVTTMYRDSGFRHLLLIVAFFVAGRQIFYIWKSTTFHRPPFLIGLGNILPRCSYAGVIYQYINDRNVCPSVFLPVRLSVCQTCDLWQNERNLCPNSERAMHLILRHEEWFVGDFPFYLNSKGTRKRKMAVLVTRFSERRDRAVGCVSFGQKWKTGTVRQYFTDIIGLSSTTVT